MKVLVLVVSAMVFITSCNGTQSEQRVLVVNDLRVNCETVTDIDIQSDGLIKTTASRSSPLPHIEVARLFLSKVFQCVFSSEDSQIVIGDPWVVIGGVLSTGEMHPWVRLKALVQVERGGKVIFSKWYETAENGPWIKDPVFSAYKDDQLLKSVELALVKAVIKLSELSKADLRAYGVNSSSKGMNRYLSDNLDGLRLKIGAVLDN